MYTHAGYLNIHAKIQAFYRFIAGLPFVDSASHTFGIRTFESWLALLTESSPTESSAARGPRYHI